jgi:hypothetical protein
MRYRPLGTNPHDDRLGRFIPDDDEHIRKYPLSAVQPYRSINVERSLKLPSWHKTHDQGAEGSCVGHGSVMERAITNSEQNKVLKVYRPTRRYDPVQLWEAAKVIDEWPETQPGDDNGTSVRAAYDVLRSVGPRPISVKGIYTPPGADRPVVEDQTQKPSFADGVYANRWARTVDEMRLAIKGGSPITIGVNWYSSFNRPQKFRGGWWLQGDPGTIQGGHCVCVFGASDAREAFRVKNSWGPSYPEVWLSYKLMERLLGEDGEATLITDR